MEASNTPRLRALDFSPFEKELAAFTPERAAEIDAIVKDADIAQVQDAVKAGKLTYAELTLYFLARIQQYDETLRTMIELNPDALKEAQAADQLLQRWQSHRRRCWAFPSRSRTTSKRLRRCTRPAARKSC